MFTASIDRLFPANTTGWICSWLFDTSLRGLAILAVTLLMSGLLRKRSAAVRHLLWLFAVAGLLLVPVLSSCLPAWRILPHVEAFVVAAADEPTQPGASFADSQRSAPTRDLSAAHALRTESAATAVAAPDGQSAKTSPADAAPSASSTTVTFSTTIVLIWGGVAAGLAAVFCLGGLSLWRTGRSARRITSGPLADLLRETARQAGVRHPVVLLVSDCRSMPMTWGVRRPRLLLPSDVDGWSPAQTRMVLLHELAHIKRRDSATQLFVEFVRIVYWFHPLPWIARRRIEALRERACDDLVLSWDCAPADYAEQLVQVSAYARLARLATGGSVGMARQSTLEGRVRAILSATQNRRALTRRNLIAGIFLLLCATIPAAMLATSSGGEELEKEAARGTNQQSKPRVSRVPDKITISGVCLDENRKPIADARVRLFFVESKAPDYRHPARDAAGKAQRQLQDVRTDKEGRFRFAAADGKEMRDKHAFLNVVAQAKGKATAWRWPDYFAATKDADATCELTLGPPETLSGRVTNADGKPVAGVVVSAGANFHGPMQAPVPGIACAVTDADGRYQITDLRAWDEHQQTFSFDMGQEHSKPTGKLVLGSGADGSATGTVLHPAYVQGNFSIRAVPDKVDITLRRPANLAGQIVLAESGKPAANARLEFRCEGNADFGLFEGSPPDWLGVYATTDAQGRYRLQTMWPDRYKLTATLDGRAPHVGFVELKPGNNRFDLRMDRGGVVKGRFVDLSTNRPVAPAAGEQMKIYISRHENSGWLHSFDHADVGADGSFTLKVSPGKIHFNPSYGGDKWRCVNEKALREEGVYVAEGQTVEVDVQLKPRNKETENAPPKPPAAAQQTPQAEQAAIAAIIKLGGEVEIKPIDGQQHVVDLNMVYVVNEEGIRHENDQMTDESLAYVPKFTKLRSLALTGKQITDKGLANLRGMGSLTHVYLWDATELTDVGAAHLATLPNLEFLDLEKSKVTDEALRLLSRLPKLTALSFQNNPFTDKGLEYLNGMTQLEQLLVGWVDDGDDPEIKINNKITDAGLRHLAGLTNLNTLDLQSTAVTDAGLVHLRGLKKLQTLLVSGTKVTEVGMDNLRLSLPRLRDLEPQD